MSDLSRRDEFAKAAMQGLGSNHIEAMAKGAPSSITWTEFLERLAHDAVRLADALIAELDRTKGDRPKMWGGNTFSLLCDRYIDGISDMHEQDRSDPFGPGHLVCNPLSYDRCKTIALALGAEWCDKGPTWEEFESRTH